MITVASSPPTDFTFTELCRICGASENQMKHALKTYDIPHRRRVGIIRLWGAEDIPTIQGALRRIAERRRPAYA